MQVTAAMLGIAARDRAKPPSHAVLSTTRDWVDDARLREGWAQFARRVRREVNGRADYAWFREWTEGRRDGVRRTHYHSVWALDGDDEAAEVARISNDVWGRIAGAVSEKAHGWQPVWDAGGLARYMAGLVGHHLKANQAPPPGWAGRRVGTSRGFYPRDARDIRSEALHAVRDERLRHRLELAVIDGCPDVLPETIVDELVTQRLEASRDRPRPRVVRLPRGFRW